jgi:LysM repeat protein
MKNFIAFLIFSLPFFAGAQTTHTVAAKESLFSIGRLYNVHPRELAAYNNIPFEVGLTIGQVLKIPAKGNMALPPASVPVKAEPVRTEPVKPAVKRATTPVYHVVAKKEGLYSISKKYNTTIADIKKWNNLSTDALSEGMNLIVGYSSTASAEPRPAPVVQNQQEPVRNIETKPLEKEPARPSNANMAATRGAANFNGGYFKSNYQKQMASKHVIEDRGMAGVFKSTSGWEDGKYYCLHNSAPAGSYIKISNPATQKSVYAKVLDLIPDLKQNSGIIIRISNAAASELGATGNNFECTLQF